VAVAVAMGYYAEGSEPVHILSDEDDFMAELWDIEDPNVPTDAVRIDSFNDMF
jgi:hypothetical protein